VLFRCCFDARPVCEWRHCGWQRRDVPSLVECSSVSVTHVHNYCTCGSLIGIYISNIPRTLAASSGSLCCDADTRFRLFLSSHEISHVCSTRCQLIMSLFYVIFVNKLPAHYRDAIVLRLLMWLCGKMTMAKFDWGRGLRSQTYGSAQRTTFSRCTYTLPQEVVEGCRVRWIQAVVECRALCSFWW
jgi:hypothetical protein